jgi:hypothetical protein
MDELYGIFYPLNNQFFNNLFDKLLNDPTPIRTETTWFRAMCAAITL